LWSYFFGSKYSGKIKVKDHPNVEIYVDRNKIGLEEEAKLFLKANL